jgi:hypothetical protein
MGVETGPSPAGRRFRRLSCPRSKTLRPRLGDADRVALGDGGAVVVAQMPFEAVTTQAGADLFA